MASLASFVGRRAVSSSGPRPLGTHARDQDYRQPDDRSIDMRGRIDGQPVAVSRSVFSRKMKPDQSFES